jgi:hypothetical protein
MELGGLRGSAFGIAPPFTGMVAFMLLLLEAIWITLKV